MAADPTAPRPERPGASASIDPTAPASAASALWQGQPTEVYRMSTATLLATAAREHRRLRLATVRTYAVMGLALAGVATLAVVIDIPLLRLALAVAALAFLFVIGVTARSARARAGAPDAALRAAAALSEPSLAHYRAELVRQRDRLTGGRLWGRFAIAVPAFALLLYAVLRADPSLARFVWLEAGAFVVVMPIAYLAGRRRARTYQQRIDELDALARADAAPRDAPMPA